MTESGIAGARTALGTLMVVPVLGGCEGVGDGAGDAPARFLWESLSESLSELLSEFFCELVAGFVGVGRQSDEESVCPGGTANGEGLRDCAIACVATKSPSKTAVILKLRNSNFNIAPPLEIFEITNQIKLSDTPQLSQGPPSGMVIKGRWPPGPSSSH
jgi:hypothetical protein